MTVAAGGPTARLLRRLQQLGSGQMRFAETYVPKGFFALARLPGQTGIALAGATGRYPPTAWLLCLDKDGLRRWEHVDVEAGIEDVHDGMDGSRNHGLAVYPDGSVVTVGTLGIHGDAVPRGFVRRFAPDGTVAWDRRFGGDAGAEFLACAALADGGLVAVGHDWQRAVSNCVIRLDAAGKVVWDVRLDDRDAWPQGVSVYPEGDVLVTGYARSPSGALQACVARLNQAGEGVFSWIWTDEPGESRFTAAVARSDGTAILAGWGAVDGDPGGREALVMMIDPSGKPLWRLRLPPWQKGTDSDPHQTEVTGVAVVADGIILSGCRIRPTQGEKRAWAAKVGSGGEPLWQDCFGEGSSSSFEGVVALEDGSALFAGRIKAAGGEDEGWLARIDADGRLKDEPVN
jgi:hypothetical protein